MVDTPKTKRRISACRFVGIDDTDPRNDILFKDPDNISEWVESLERCNEIVEERMDEIERRILGKGKIG
ncbi:MAG TPA: hypothetical protein P5114_02055 [Hyphomicrobiaceae bacterium]|nr:hypothetical protein [Hyphomicrobiaceae bacterium]